jgi:hypothetical protein
MNISWISLIGLRPAAAKNPWKGGLKVSDSMAKWLAIIGILVGVVGFFWKPLIMGSIAVAAGVIGQFSTQKKLSWIAVAVGAIALVLGII